MKLAFQEYRARKIVNVHKHVDGPWFWGKYTAHPYVGCRSGCEFCYARGSRYLGRRDPTTFDTLILVKTNAAELLRKELPPLEREIISVGDWQQPAESRYRLSRSMLEVVRDLGFPLYVNERSPLLVRDLDLLIEINHQSWVGVAYSLSGVDPALKRAFEPHSPGVKRRLQAMRQLAEAGITVGASLTPILPLVGDDPAHLDETIQAIKDHGGSFVLAGGLTMDGVQAERVLAAARQLDPSLEARWRELYGWSEGGQPNYSPPRPYVAQLGLRVRELCARHGLLDRLPRSPALALRASAVPGTWRRDHWRSTSESLNAFSSRSTIWNWSRPKTIASGPTARRLGRWTSGLRTSPRSTRPGVRPVCENYPASVRVWPVKSLPGCTKIKSRFRSNQAMRQRVFDALIPIDN